MEDLFLVVRLPAWSKTLRSRVNAKPKAHIVDSGLAARLLRLNPNKQPPTLPAAVSRRFTVRVTAAWIEGGRSARVDLEHHRCCTKASVHFRL